jgi:hypothetical protein
MMYQFVPSLVTLIKSYWAASDFDTAPSIVPPPELTVTALAMALDRKDQALRGGSCRSSDRGDCCVVNRTTPAWLIFIGLYR